MRAGIRIVRLTLSDGSIVPLTGVGTVLIVGPNNAGKSQALRDLAKNVGSLEAEGLVIQEAVVEHVGSAEDLRKTWEADGSISQTATTASYINLGPIGPQSVGVALSWWDGRNNSMVAPYFVLRADTESRLEASKPADALNLYEVEPHHALHRLYLQPEVETRLDEISRQAFGQGVFLDTWSGGSSWSLRVGDLERPTTPRPPQAYLDALRELPLLQEQGDGVRSLMGLLLELLTGHHSVYLLDEPEAFLHPPQARYFAKVLSETTDEQAKMTFLSTHSADIVHGTLEGPASATVIRLVRRGNVNYASVLDNEAVRRLWNDPLLRYSNLLEGLFTDAVIICESDADCKFFAAMRDGLTPVDEGARRPDVLFTSVGGKHRMHVAVEALKASSVPVAVIGDFDVLNDWDVLARLITAAAGNPDDFRRDWTILNAALTAGSRTPSVAGMKEAVNQVFDEMTSVTDRSVAAVKAALKIENGWDKAKNTGLTGLPKGDVYSAAVRLLEQLAVLGIHLIPVGEMEDFVPQVGGHGPGWLAQVLENDLHESSSTDESRAFFEKVLSTLS